MVTCIGEEVRCTYVEQGKIAPASSGITSFSLWWGRILPGALHSQSSSASELTAFSLLLLRFACYLFVPHISWCESDRRPPHQDDFAAARRAGTGAISCRLCLYVPTFDLCMARGRAGTLVLRGLWALCNHERRLCSISLCTVDK
jgi:hypothetical protein